MVSFTPLQRTHPLQFANKRREQKYGQTTLIVSSLGSVERSNQGLKISLFDVFKDFAFPAMAEFHSM